MHGQPAEEDGVADVQILGRPHRRARRRRRPAASRAGRDDARGPARASAAARRWARASAGRRRAESRPSSSTSTRADRTRPGGQPSYATDRRQTPRRRRSPASGAAGAPRIVSSIASEPRLRAQRHEGGMGQHHAKKLDPAGIVVGAERDAGRSPARSRRRPRDRASSARGRRRGRPSRSAATVRRGISPGQKR